MDTLNQHSPAATITTDPLSARLVERVQRPTVRGKFLFRCGRKLYIRGVTYGAFRPQEDGAEFPEPSVVQRDFAQMAMNGVSSIRTYTMPPRWLLDTAHRHGLVVMVGLSMELYVGYLSEPATAPDLEEIVRARVRTSVGHPAILCYAVGNEIPATLVRWHGPNQIERYLELLYRAVKSVDPQSLVTYVNYPSTEYLRLPFLELVCFNVYLEEPEELSAYLARLQNIAGDRAVLMTELGLDSQRHGETEQALVLEWQLRETFAAGCAGAFVFAWTDQWYAGGAEVLDWDFGLTRRDRQPKPALASVRDVYGAVPFPTNQCWPSISVVVCSHNGARTIRDCLEGLRQMEYPRFEVIVVDDGSTDATARIAGEYDVRVIRTPNAGLSSARNTGTGTATGVIVAFIDDDAWPDPHWLAYLAVDFMTTDHVGMGGPNLAPPGDGMIADCIANSPGGPIHVLRTDRVAEHIPGCNMAFRKHELQRIGGFDPQFRVAGDDVDVCWKLQEQGWTIGFSPAAMVWHRRRNSLRAYARQQHGYGKAEALLELKWPQRYNSTGHVTWQGQLYGQGVEKALSWGRSRVYYGPWGSAPFQSLYQPAPGNLASLLLMPEWYLILLALAALTCLGLLWSPLLVAAPMLVGAVVMTVVQAGMSAARCRFPAEPSRRGLVARRWLTATLHLIQPMARLHGRLSHGLTPWRWHGSGPRVPPWPARLKVWSEQGQPLDSRLRALEATITAASVHVVRGGAFDRWDLQVRGGLLGGVRLLMAIEEQNSGNQLVRVRLWPTWSPHGLGLACLLTILACAAMLDHAQIAAAFLGFMAALLLARGLWESTGSMGVARQALVRTGLGDST